MTWLVQHWERRAADYQDQTIETQGQEIETNNRDLTVVKLGEGCETDNYDMTRVTLG